MKSHRAPVATPQQQEREPEEGAAPADVLDVCIIGAGPHGLAVLSALHSPTAWMTDMQRERSFQAAKDKTQGRKKQDWSVCVVDDHPWLGAWNQRFKALDIEWLRSPARAHPSGFNEDALIEFARRTGRSSELKALNFEQGHDTARNYKMRGFVDTYTGLYALPTHALFRDFCTELADSLPHEFVRSRAQRIIHHPAAKDTAADVPGELMEVLLENGSRVWARNVVLAIGAAGPPNVPAGLRSSCTRGGGGGAAELLVPPQQLLHTSEWYRFHEIEKGDRVLVVGGGLSAAQAALLAVNRGAAAVTLCSRRPLETRHFDLPLNWFDPRYVNKMRFPFYERSHEERLRWTQGIKGGGTVPPMYMAALAQAAEQGRLTLHQNVQPRVVVPSFSERDEGGDHEPSTAPQPQWIQGTEEELRPIRVAFEPPPPVDGRLVAPLEHVVLPGNDSVDDSVDEPADAAAGGSTQIQQTQRHQQPQVQTAQFTNAPGGGRLEGGGKARADEQPSAAEFDKILLGTGHKPDWRSLPLLRDLLDDGGEAIPTVGGFPVLSTELQLGSLPVFVVGALAALQLGPGALNLMGARHGADIVATRLGVNADPEEGKIGGIFSNVFTALAGDSSSDGEASDSEDGSDTPSSPPSSPARPQAKVSKKTGRKKKKNNGRGGRKHRH